MDNENKIKQILLKKSAYMNLLRTVLESASREPTGFLFGSKRKDKLTFTNAYPIITADRQPTSVTYGNNNAIKRIRGFHKVMSEIGSTEGNIVGGYHSHPIVQRDNLQEMNKLSVEDLDAINEEMEEYKQNYWVEILVRFKEKKLQTKHQIGKKIKKCKNKMRVTIKDSPNHKYDMLISAYLVKNKKSDTKIKSFKSKPGKLKRHNYKVTELKVRYN